MPARSFGGWASFARTASKEDDGETKDTAGRELDERLGGGEQLEVVDEGQQLLGEAEGTGLLELREDARLFRATEQASFRQRRQHLELLHPSQNFHRLFHGLLLLSLAEGVELCFDELRPRRTRHAQTRRQSQALSVGAVARRGGLSVAPELRSVRGCVRQR